MTSQATGVFDGLILMEGEIYTKALVGEGAAPLELVCQNATIPFEKADRRPVDSAVLFPLAGVQAVNRSASDSRDMSDLCAPLVNQLENWGLPGVDTLQLLIKQPDEPLHIDLSTNTQCHSSGKPRVFSAKLATHRANAQLHVVFTDVESGAEKTHKVMFDGTKRGGTFEQDYQSVDLMLPRGFGTCEVRLSLEYLSFADDGSGDAPFLFLSNPKVDLATGKHAISRPIVLASPMRGLQGKWEWVKAPLPLTAAPRKGAFAIKSGRKTFPVQLEEAAKITCVDKYNNTIVLRASETQDAVLCIDGEPAMRCRIGTEDVRVQIPARFLNGATRHISIKDPSASVPLLETLMLLPAVLTPAEIIQRETSAPFPTSIFAQTPHRYEALKQALAHATKDTDLEQLAYALSVLEGGYHKVKLKPLAFPKVDKPDVSVIIPAHNKVEVTYLALCSLLLAHNKASFEVIVVDDASTDETAKLETIVSGITVLHNDPAQRFIRACNRGAEAAKGDYIVLLNNDVEVTVGWLDELIAAFSRFDNVGLVGSKLLYPNGQLQDAGGIIWGSGNPWNYGNRQNPMDPRFSYARQADYLSGAAMMVPAKLWNELGGLSSYLEPMYFEDTDFAFKVREAGYSTWFVPSSIVYHYEGMTSGTDTSTGFKKYQEVNRPKFKRQWAKAYAGFGKEGHNPDLEKDRGIVGRVLFVDYATPRPDHDAGSYAALQEMRLVQSLGYKVTFMPINLSYLGRYTEDLQKMGVEVIYAPFFSSMDEYLESCGADFDAVYITRYYVAQDVLPLLQKRAPQAKTIFNNADLHFLREIRAAKSEDNDARLEQARQTREAELDVIGQVDVVLSYNDVEHSVIQAFTDGQATVMKCPWVVDQVDQVPDLSERKGMSFLGGFMHHPNKEGIIWFARDIMPKVTAKTKDLPLAIYGSKMDDDIRALETELIHPIGFVESVADAYDQHRIFVAPLLSGAGIKGKVLSALAHGIPCVLSPVAAEGIGLRSGYDCFIAETPEQWADAIARLSTDDVLWQKISQNAVEYVSEAFSFERGRRFMRQAFEAVDLFQSKD